MAWDDWDDDSYDHFHDQAFLEVFNHLDFAYMSDDEIAQAEDYFEQGWLNFHIPAEEKNQWREAFYNLTNLELSSDEWRTYRELYDEAGG